MAFALSRLRHRLQAALPTRFQKPDGTQYTQESTMSKGMDQKKDQKKKPAKTMKEKKAEKRDKKSKA